MQRDKALCEYCSEQYKPIRRDQRFCSRACHNEWWIENRRQAIAAWARMHEKILRFDTTLDAEDDEMQSERRRA